MVQRMVIGTVKVGVVDDSGDICYQKHDNCYDCCKGNVSCVSACDKGLVEDLKKLPKDTTKWEVPPKKGTDGQSEAFKNGAIKWFN